MTDAEREQWRVCYHEAGHAIAAELYGYRVVYVTATDKGGNTLGVTEFRPPSNTAPARPTADYLAAQQHARARGDFKLSTPKVGDPPAIYLAGIAAEQILNARSMLSGCGTDLDCAAYLLIMQGVPGSELRAALGREIERTRDLLAAAWGKVCVVALELHARGTLTGPEVRELLGTPDRGDAASHAKTHGRMKRFDEVTVKPDPARVAERLRKQRSVAFPQLHMPNLTRGVVMPPELATLAMQARPTAQKSG